MSRRVLILLVVAAVALCQYTAHANQIKTPALPGIDSSDLGYVPNQIIVKFRKSAADIVESGLPSGKPPQDLRISESLDKLNTKHKLKSIDSLFPNFKKHLAKLEKIKTKNKAKLTKKEKHILQRLKRAPKNAQIIALDRIYKFSVDLEAGQSLEDVVAEYTNDPSVEYAELNYIMHISEPNDTHFDIQWPLENTGQTYPESGYYNLPPGGYDADIDAPEAWAVFDGEDCDVVVAVIDTGVDYLHRDLADNMWTDPNGAYGYDFANDDYDPIDDHGHGTHCAGIIAAVTDNQTDIAGVCRGAKIMALKIFDATGSGGMADALRAVNYAIANGADVMSNSYGWDPNGPWWGPQEEYLEPMQDAITTAHGLGILFVAAAGNSGTSGINYPAYCDDVISVAATDSNDLKASFSTYGEWVDLAAPGVDILSLRAARSDMGTVYTDYTTIASGTSMACPHVSGACALLMAINPSASLADIEDAIIDTGDDIADGICSSDRRLNLFNAVEAIITSEGHVRFTDDYYTDDSTVTIFLTDSDLDGDSSVDVTVISDGGDSATVTLWSSDCGFFSGTILTDVDTVDPNDETLQISNGNELTVTYQDDDDGTGSSAVATDTALVDTVAPQISYIVFDSDPNGPDPVVVFETNEATLGCIKYGESVEGPFVSHSTGLGLEHAVKLTKALPLTDYYFKIEVTDPAGNTTTADNEGSFYEFTTDGPVELYVPSEYSTIQDAMDQPIWDGSTIWVSEGTYGGSLSFEGKNVIVTSTDPDDSEVVAATILNCTYGDPAVRLEEFEGPDSVLTGFTVRGMYGVYCKGSDPTISKCVFDESLVAIYLKCANPEIFECDVNVPDSMGIRAERGKPTVRDCDISALFGLEFYSAVPTVRDCGISDCYIGVIVDNCDDASIVNNDIGNNSYGIVNRTIIGTDMLIAGNLIHDNVYTGVRLENCIGDTIKIRNNWIYGNTDGVKCPFGVSNLTLENNTIVNNTGYGVYLDPAENDGPVSVVNSILWGNGTGLSDCTSTYSCGQVNPNGTGNITSDPSFVDAANDDYHIASDSPCIDAGDDTAVNSTEDIDGDERIIDVDVDMGADEFKAAYILDGDNYSSIQSAIVAAAADDTVVVYPGIYYENIDFDGKAITVTSTDPNDWDVVEATIIDADSSGDTVTFENSEDANSVLTGFTITGAYSNGVECTGADPAISKCIITGNGASGIFSYYCSPLIDACKIHDNTYGIMSWGESPQVTNCLIFEQDTGVLLHAGSTATITNTTVVDNFSYGIANGAYTSTPTITNCIIWGNTDDLHDSWTATYSCIEDGDAGTGNIRSDPEFVDAANDDYHLTTQSPCLDVGDPNGVYTGQTDIDGDDRVIDILGIGDGIVDVDMGADENPGVVNITTDVHYSTIQAAINEASEDDELVAYPGTYTEFVVFDFDDCAITLSSIDPDDPDVVAATIITPPEYDYVVVFSGDNTSVLDGFTIDGGSGVRCDGSEGVCSPTISNCIINRGIYCTDSSALITNCTLSGYMGPGVHSDGAIPPEIRNNWIYENQLGIVINYATSSATIQNNTIVGNSIGVGSFYGTEPVITNCILWDNGVDLSGCSATYSCIEDGDAGTGNISSDPDFVDAANDDYHLLSTSPCIDVGDPDGDYTGQTDIDGDDRVIDIAGKGDGTVDVDMGADEYDA